MIKLAVFDLDGTLVDSLTDLALSVNKGLKKAGLPEHPIEKYNKFVGNGREMLIRRAIGEEPIDEDWANQHFITKNFGASETMAQEGEANGQS